MSNYAIMSDELYHHGIKGQKWGVRRFQNADGSLKPAGEKRYGSDGSSGSSKPSRAERKAAKQEAKRASINDYKKILTDTAKADAKSDGIWKEATSTYKSLGKNKIERIKEVIKAQKGEGSEAAKKYLDLYDKSTKVADDAFDRKMEADSKYKKSIKKAAEKEIKKEEKAAKKEAKIKDSKDAVKAYQKAADKALADTDKANDYYNETVKPLYNSLAKTKIGRVREVIKAQKGKGSKAANEYLKAMDKSIRDRDKADEAWKASNELYKKTGKTYAQRIMNNAKYGS